MVGKTKLPKAVSRPLSSETLAIAPPPTANYVKKKANYEHNFVNVTAIIKGYKAVLLGPTLREICFGPCSTCYFGGFTTFAPSK